MNKRIAKKIRKRKYDDKLSKYNSLLERALKNKDIESQKNVLQDLRKQLENTSANSTAQKVVGLINVALSQPPLCGDCGNTCSGTCKSNCFSECIGGSAGNSPLD